MRLLLIQICTVFSLGAFSQKISPNNKVLIENFPTAATYSIQLKHSTGEIISLGSSKVYIAALFPQLDKMKAVKDSGDVIVNVVMDKSIGIGAIRERSEYARMLSDYNRLEPLPNSSPPGKYLYFQPFTLSFQSKGSVFFTMPSIGKLLERNADRMVDPDDTSREKLDALTSLEFLRGNIFKLAGDQE